MGLGDLEGEQHWGTLLREGHLESGGKEEEEFGKEHPEEKGQDVRSRCSEHPRGQAGVQDQWVGAWL